MQQAGAATNNESAARFEVFRYPAGADTPPPGFEGWNGVDGSQDAGPESGGCGPELTAEAEAALRAEFDGRLGEEARKSFEAGREKGQQEGRRAEQEAQAEGLTAANQLRARQGTELVEKFVHERDRYLQLVEHEVVELALAVAARILRREAQMDPLLLTGAVRVALGQLSASTAVKLRVPPGDLDLWTEAIALIPNLPVKPAIVAREGMRLGDCLVETELGSVDLGIRSQLGEIERGFFDRAGGVKGKRPAASVEAAVPAAGATA